AAAGCGPARPQEFRGRVGLPVSGSEFALEGSCSCSPIYHPAKNSLAPRHQRPTWNTTAIASSAVVLVRRRRQYLSPHVRWERCQHAGDQSKESEGTDPREPVAGPPPRAECPSQRYLTDRWQC